MVLIFFVRIELSGITESPNRVEHSDRPLGIFVDIGYHESQVHTSSQLFFRAEDVAPRRIYSFYSRKERAPAATSTASYSAWATR
jgi:hypothetical protein